MTASIKAVGFLLQEEPPIYITALPGKWLLRHATPSLRIKNPIKGFQRLVKEKRAMEIAVAVLDQKRTFPNAIVLATSIKSFELEDGQLKFDSGTRFLVVDGQHRLYAQKFSEFEARYACTIHCNLSKVAMANLFLEINDSQKRVPSSLRWDLVRLVRPDDDPFAVAAAELVYALNTEETSPLYQRIDLTGEQTEIGLKQGSLAPELKTLVSKRSSPLRTFGFETQYEVLVAYVNAIRSLDSDGWKNGDTPFYQARILRVLIRLLPEILKNIKTDVPEIDSTNFKAFLNKIDKNSISLDVIRAKQGTAGMKEIYTEIHGQIFE